MMKIFTGAKGRNRRKGFCFAFILCLWIDVAVQVNLGSELLDGDEKFAGAEKVEEFTRSPGVVSENDDNFTRPWVPKCCNLYSGFAFENKSQCVKTEDEFLPDFEDRPDYLDTAKKLPAETRYEYFIGDPCQDGKYILDLTAYPDDKFSVYTNGTLLHLDRLYYKEEFCLETLNGSIRAFICFGTDKPELKLNFTFIIYAIGLFISIPFLLATAFTYLCIDLFRDLHGKSLSCHVFCLAIGYLVLAIVQVASDQLDEALCIAAGFVIQFFFVASFFWLNVISYETWRCINDDFRCTIQPRNPRSEKYLFLGYSIYGWYGPIIISIITLIMDLEPAIPESYLKPNFGLRSCWFYSDDAALPYFYGPVAIVISINIIFFFLSARKIYLEEKKRLKCQTHKRDSTEETHLPIALYTKTLQECIYLFCIMGINWAAEVISWAVGGSQIIWLITDVFNALQGLMIFYLFVLRPERVRNKVKSSLYRTWKKIILCDCQKEQQNKRINRHCHSNVQYDVEENENDKFLPQLNTTAV